MYGVHMDGTGDQYLYVAGLYLVWNHLPHALASACVTMFTIISIPPCLSKVNCQIRTGGGVQSGRRLEVVV